MPFRTALSTGRGRAVDLGRPVIVALMPRRVEHASQHVGLTTRKPVILALTRKALSDAGDGSSFEAADALGRAITAIVAAVTRTPASK